jgi:hypothetical protein
MAKRSPASREQALAAFSLAWSNVGDLQRDHLHGPQTGSVGNAERRVKKVIDIFRGEMDLVMCQIGCPQPQRARPRLPAARRLDAEPLIFPCSADFFRCWAR